MALLRDLFIFVVYCCCFLQTSQAVTIDPAGPELVVDEAGNLELSCTGSEQVQWYHEDQAVNGSNPRYTMFTQRVRPSPEDRERTVGVLQAESLTRSDGGMYGCRPDPPRGEPGDSLKVIVRSYSGLVPLHDSILDGGDRVVLGCNLTDPEQYILVRWFRTENTTEILEGPKYSMDSQLGTLTINNADASDAGVYTCMFQMTESYRREQRVFLSCLWGHSQPPYGCPDPGRSNPGRSNPDEDQDHTNCGALDDVVSRLIPERLLGRSDISMDCRRNDQCSGIQCSTTIRMRRMQRNGDVVNVTSDMCFGVDYSSCQSSVTFFTETNHTNLPNSGEIQIPIGYFEVANTTNNSYVEQSYVTLTNILHENSTDYFHLLKIRFETKAVQDGTESWPSELAFDILPLTIIPKLPCSDNQDSRYIQICGTQVDTRDPKTQIAPVQRDTEILINNKTILVPKVQGYNGSSNIGYQRFCEGRMAQLRCPPARTLRVLSSVYGRQVSYQDDTVCSYNGNGALDTTECQTNTTDTIILKCNTLESCQFFVDDSLNGNPCSDVNKYVDVIFTCVTSVPSQPPVCHQSQLQCSSGQCVPGPWWCDGYTDCLDGSDENNCTSTASTSGSTTEFATPSTPTVLSTTKSTSATSESTPKGTTIVTRQPTTVGRRKTKPPQTTRMGMLSPTRGFGKTTPVFHPTTKIETPPVFKFTTKMIDLVTTIYDNCGKGQYLCESESKCLGIEDLCDGKSDCVNGEDELDCANTLPVTEAHTEKSSLWWMVLLGVGAVLVVAIVIGSIVGVVIFRRQKALKRQQQDYAAAGFVNSVPPTVTLEPKAGAEYA